ncbi:MAG: DUF3822 family protein [Bacteroidia bacterium]
MKDKSTEKKTFDNIENLSLTMEVGFSDYSALVFDEVKNQCVFSESFSFTSFNDFEEKTSLIGFNFREVKIYLFTPDFTLVPNALTENGNLTDFLHLACGEKKHASVRYDVMNTINATITYYADEKLLSFFSKHFSNAQFFHSATKFISEHKQSDDLSLNIHLYNNHFMVCYFKNKALQFANGFEYNHFNDLIYLLLFTTKSLNLTPSETTINISGHFNPNVEQHILKYFKTTVHSEKTISNLELKQELLPRFSLLVNH